MASKRVLIVGGVAGGAACAARLRRMDEEAEIFIFERGRDVSFANCGLPYYIGGVITERKRLLVAGPETFRDLMNVEVRVQSEVEKIDRDAKTISVRNVQSGNTTEEHYDTLVLAPGAMPIRPPIDGLDLDGVFCLRNLDDVDRIHSWIEHREARRAVVVGAGAIGLEMTENLTRRGMSVTLLERLDQVMPPIDREMLAPARDVLTKNGVRLMLSSGLAAVETGPNETLVVVTADNERLPADIVLVAVGVKPETALASDAGLEIGERGGIRVDDQMRTTDPAIFAVGDAVEIRDLVTDEWTRFALAGPAVRQARVAADVISGRDVRYRGSQGTGVVGLFDLTLAMTGANEKTLQRAEIPFEKCYLHEPNHAGYFPGASMISIKLLYAPESGRILGAQAVGKSGVEKRIDVISMALQKQGTVFDLEEAELCYAPQYGSARDPVNLAGFVAANALRGDVDVVHWEDWHKLPERSEEEKPLVLDVRPTSVRAKASVPGTLGIPMGELRRRLDELPRDREIWIHCGVGRTSYYACRLLKQKGYQVRNLSGGIMSYKMSLG